MTLLCVAVVIVCMAWEIPEAAVAAYLIFFASRDDAGSSAIMGFALIIIVILAIAMAFVVTTITAGAPLLRILSMATLVFGSMFLTSASRLGPVASALAMVLAMALTAPDLVGYPELITRAFLWLIPMVLVPMALLILLDLLMGRDPVRLYRDNLRRRFAAAATMLSAPRTDRPPVGVRRDARCQSGHRDLQQDGAVAAGIADPGSGPPRVTRAPLHTIDHGPGRGTRGRVDQAWAGTATSTGAPGHPRRPRSPSSG
jgi:uncharacterized membrane protein YccC